jgi:hypothetical protein
MKALDEIAWGELEHAHGSAEDVPVRLRALASDDPADREQARDALWSSLVRDGTRYSAAPHAVPSLLSLAADERVADREQVLLLLTELVALDLGLAGGLAFDGERVLLQGAWVTRDAAPLDAAQADVLAQTHAAVAAGLDTVVGLLSATDPMLRYAALYLLATMGRHVDRFREAVSVLGGDARQPWPVRALARFTLWLAGEAPNPEDDDHPNVALTSWAMLARSGDQLAAERVLAVLRLLPPDYGSLLIVGHDPLLALTEAVRLGSPAALASRLDALCDALPMVALQSADRFITIVLEAWHAADPTTRVDAPALIAAEERFWLGIPDVLARHAIERG